MNDFDLEFYRAIKSPIETKLEEILKLLKKDDLLTFAEDYTITGRSKMNKEKLNSELCKRMLNSGNLEDALFVATKDELTLFKKLLEVPYSEKGKVTYGKLRYLTAMGLIFMFQQDKTIYLVVPEEIKELYRQIDQKKIIKEHKKIDEVHRYILAMTNLYGAFHVNLLYETFNKQNGDKLNYEEFADIVFRLENRQQYFYIYAGSIISEYYELPEMEDGIRANA